MNCFDDTITAISTPSGKGGIGIVRLSGKNAIETAEKIFTSPKNKGLKQTPSHKIIYGHIINSNKEIVDEVLISIMRAPNTYTKENVVEINCHGGAVPLRRVLELVLKNGARLAMPGEFTQRALINGRIDLAQAEAVLDAINSATEQSQKAAMEQLSGGLSKKIHSLRDKLVELTAFVEAHIDFPEEDIESPSLSDMQKKALEICGEITKLIEGSRHGMILREGLKTAIIGRPNVGKSSLLNALLTHDRAIVTEMPGTTRDVIEEYLDINGFPVRIMDTAGIREAKDIAEKESVERSLSAMKGADLVVLVLDGSEDLHNTDRELIERSASQNTILVINKTDLKQKLNLKNVGQENVIPAKAGIQTSSPDTRSKSQANLIGVTRTFEHWIPGQARNDKPEQKIIKTSALTGAGLDELRNKIMNIISDAGGGEASHSRLVTNIRHVHALEKALASMNSFIEGVDNKLSPEFLSVELREALDALGEITGITTPEDILNKIFSDFCIGK
ncbi:MAG: tRNA uridine-5-carboxymethylaminomethyl(34) synthesis GTPase MnmE [Nitrospirae bacterium]|nr:tRNA uridine-5-carboxymethylaminomethyl(34) synthesis GTPase MnmE [Nitrospirota bacterium]